MHSARSRLSGGHLDKGASVRAARRGSIQVLPAAETRLNDFDVVLNVVHGFLLSMTPVQMHHKPPSRREMVFLSSRSALGSDSAHGKHLARRCKVLDHRTSPMSSWRVTRVMLNTSLCLLSDGQWTVILRRLAQLPRRKRMSALEHRALVETPAPLKSVAATMVELRAKIAEDLVRFRTCCADPRASK